jgi:hypothetical protein
MKQDQRRYSLFRRIFFPYSGEELLTLKQSLRVIMAWIVVIPVAMTLLTLLLSILLSFTLQRILLLLLVSFVSGAFIFGSLSLLVIATNNRLARIRQERQLRRNRPDRRPWR